MTYSLSEQILEKINSSKNILVNCHKSPDVDSISSALAMCQVLVKMGKNVEVISPDPPLSELSFLSCFENIKVINYSNFVPKDNDLFLLLDSGSSEVVTGSKDVVLPNLSTIVIDHHKTNTNFGQINLVDPDRSATAELLYLLFLDWAVEIDKNLADTLLTGILGDTGAFEYHTTPKTLQIAAELMIKGADKDEILLRIFRSKQMNLLKFWGEVLNNFQIDNSNIFSWCAIPYSIYENFGKPPMARNSASTMFVRMVDKTEFGLIMVEEEPGILHISLRARGSFDVSKIAQELGGGGHPGAAGAAINLPFDDAVEKVLDIAKKYAQIKKS